MADKQKPKSVKPSYDENGFVNNPDDYVGVTRTWTDEKGDTMSHTIGQDEVDDFKKKKATAGKKKTKLNKLYPSQDPDSVTNE